MLFPIQSALRELTTFQAIWLRCLATFVNGWSSLSSTHNASKIASRTTAHREQFDLGESSAAVIVADCNEQHRL
jgi:hypothetical protein